MRQVARPRTEEAIAPVRFTRVEKSPQMNGPRKTEPMAPQEIPRMETIVAGLKYARTTDKKMKKTLRIRMRNMSFLSDTSGLIKPAYMSLTTDELEISISADSVDMEADKMRRRIRIDSDVGMTVDSRTGINASKIGLPFEKASGVVSGVRKTRAVAPVK